MRKSSREVQEKYKNIVDLKKKKVLSFEGSGSTKKKKKRLKFLHILIFCNMNRSTIKMSCRNINPHSNWILTGFK